MLKIVKVKVSSFLSAAVLASVHSPATYAPAHVPCPSDSLLRVFTPANQTLHPREAQYVDARLQDLPATWNKWIDVDALGYDLQSLGGDQGVNFPKVGIALSGGGYRAALMGAGVLSALDSRDDKAAAAGTGGLLQVASYISGLSGGAWLLSSWAFSSMPMMRELVLGSEDGSNAGWITQADIFTPADADFPAPGTNASAASMLESSYYDAMLAGVQDKATAGFNVSLTDVWSRALSYHFLRGTNKENYFDNSTHGTGTRFSGGKPVDASSCVTGFDQAGFVFGTSSNLFAGLVNVTSGQVQGLSNSPGAATALKTVLGFLSSVSKGFLDVANYPNPFRGIKPGQFQDSDAGEIQLIDGGLNVENIPLSSLMIKARAVDVIVAVDASSDDANLWPNGIALYATSNRSVLVSSEVDQRFPPLPLAQADFVRMGLNQRPTFLGCNPKQLPPEFPLVVYIPNTPPVDGTDPITNTNTLKTQYSTNHTSRFLDAARSSAISGFVPNELGADPNFGKCLQCAAVDRARLKASPPVPRSEFCGKCFEQYCYEEGAQPGAVVGRKLEYFDPDTAGGEPMAMARRSRMSMTTKT
ncbi:hypothetical protein BOTBODRAFT_180172 [Botryobasidium botryosum FD-172 SS1]|uniref:Lysophospholipase n=1 Tax=Botryobasidium botryosum (strain FD-172 SS1) TaxID=930990 RepID=A0A067LXS9_BOTB1|nr:hypothetical protein BOTBODRAFT_180172 [Botryobasidium botryosum FD-172 SS1]